MDPTLLYKAKGAAGGPVVNQQYDVLHRRLMMIKQTSVN